MAQPFESRQLTSGWSFKESGAKEWLPVARVPTNVHLDLLDNDKYAIKFITEEIVLTGY